MRVLLAAVGTRGDVQPALALAVELRKLGHAVRLCISPNFVQWAQGLGFEAVPMGVEMRMPGRKSGPLPTLTPEELRRLRESMPDLITDQFETIGSAVAGCDVIVGANAHQYAVPSIAEHAGIGCVTAIYAPVALPSPDLTKAWNERALDRVNHNRGRLGMKPIDDVLDYVLTDHTWLAADATLAPMPLATPDREIFQTGTWVLADRTPLPADLETFIGSGARPVFAGFGSMPAAGEVTRQLIGAARAVGRRIIVSRGWADLDLIDDADDCIAVGDVSHDVLFPRVAAVVHHGGAGTTAAAARAGVPQVITPMFGDQFYWAGRVVDLGVGTATPHTGMTEESLTDALRRALRPAAVAEARKLATQVTWDGAEVAAKRLDATYGGRGHRA